MSAVPDQAVLARGDRPGVGAIPGPQRATAARRARSAAGDPARHVLVLRFALVNLVGFALLAVLALHGYVGQAAAADATGLVQIIAAVFAVGLVLCGRRVVEVSRELQHARHFDPLAHSRAADYVAQVRGLDLGQQAAVVDNLKLTLGNRLAVIRHIANSLVLLGLIGTVIGFIMALAGVDPSMVANIEAVSPMVAQLISGMSVALYTTLVGAALHLWLIVNYHILATGTVELIDALTRLGKRHARP